MGGHTRLNSQRNAKNYSAADIQPFSSAAGRGKPLNTKAAGQKVHGKKGKKRFSRRGYADGGATSLGFDDALDASPSLTRFNKLVSGGMSNADAYAKLVQEGYYKGEKPSDNDRFNQLTSSGISRQDAYEKMLQEIHGGGE